MITLNQIQATPPSPLISRRYFKIRSGCPRPGQRLCAVTKAVETRELRLGASSDLSLALVYSAAKRARQVSPNSVPSSRVSPTKLTTRDTFWRGARGSVQLAKAHNNMSGTYTYSYT